MGKLIDITGKRLGRLIVVEKREPRKGGGSDWLCRCDCGNEIVAIGSNLRRGDTQSCGCLRHAHAVAMGSNPEYIAKRAEKAVRHGHKRRGKMTPEYRIWLGMKRRCYDIKCKDYPNWGGRGITVCERWLHSFQNFLDDMGPRPTAYTIDRKDPNADYSPENCRWATSEQQGGENKRTNLVVCVEGVTFDGLAAAARHYGIGLSKVRFRIENGIDIQTALTFKGRLKPRRDRESYLPKSKR